MFKSELQKLSPSPLPGSSAGAVLVDAVSNNNAILKKCGGGMLNPELPTAALMSLPSNGVKEEDLSYKNLLQELAQKEGYDLPTYTTNLPTFKSTVEIDGQRFTGEESKSKKAAELSAAKVAYSAIKRKSNETDNCPSCNCSCSRRNSNKKAKSDRLP